MADFVFGHRRTDNVPSSLALLSLLNALWWLLLLFWGERRSGRICIAGAQLRSTGLCAGHLALHQLRAVRPDAPTRLSVMNPLPIL